MFAHCFRVNDNKSGNVMPMAAIGLTLSYSFFR